MLSTRTLNDALDMTQHTHDQGTDSRGGVPDAGGVGRSPARKDGAGEPANSPRQEEPEERGPQALPRD